MGLFGTRFEIYHREALSQGSKTDIKEIDEATNVNAIEKVRDGRNRKCDLIDQNTEGIEHSEMMSRDM